MTSCVTPDRPDACLFGRFAAQAARTPEAIAATFADSKFSYGDLRQREDTAVGIEMLVDAATAFREAFRELEAGLLDAQADVDTLVKA